MGNFKFAIGQTVALALSGLTAEVIGQGHFKGSQDQFQVWYKTPLGEEKTEWVYEYQIKDPTKLEPINFAAAPYCTPAAKFFTHGRCQGKTFEDDLNGAIIKAWQEEPSRPLTQSDFIEADCSSDDNPPQTVIHININH